MCTLGIDVEPVLLLPRSQIRQKKEGEIRKKLEEKAQAQAFANALGTIGKFIIKKKTGKQPLLTSTSWQLMEGCRAARLFHLDGEPPSAREAVSP